MALSSLLKITGRHLRCSVCQKKDDEVRSLIAGPRVYICDECVDICLEILSKSFERKPENCLICGTTQERGKMKKIPHRGLICDACAKTLKEMMNPTASQP